MSPTRPRTKALWLARLEYRFHGWREHRARRRGQTPMISAYPGYGGQDWVRVLGRVLIVPRVRAARKDTSVRGWRSFAAVPVAYAQVSVTIAGVTRQVVADRGGVVDVVLPGDLPSGWQPITMQVEDSEPMSAQVFVVGADVDFGIVSDVDDTVMITALPRPLVAAWNSFVLDEHARQPVPGMAVLLERLSRQHPGAPVVYLSTGAWNVAPTLQRFLRRHLFPAGALLLTDWGPTHDRWFRSGREHKRENLRRLAEQFPHIRWMLIGDDGQHDDAVYTEFTERFPDHVAAVAIRRLSTAEAVLAGGRVVVSDHVDQEVPWVTGEDGAAILDRLEEIGVVSEP